jgi:hypothetical protein
MGVRPAQENLGENRPTQVEAARGASIPHNPYAIANAIRPGQSAWLVVAARPAPAFGF